MSNPCHYTLVQQQYIGTTKSCIHVVESKIVTSRYKLIDISICLLLEQIKNDISVHKYKKSRVVPSFMCNKPC